MVSVAFHLIRREFGLFVTNGFSLMGIFDLTVKVTYWTEWTVVC